MTKSLQSSNEVGGDGLSEWLTQKCRRHRQQATKGGRNAVARLPGAVACTAQ